jgi:hypothetical protein
MSDTVQAALIGAAVAALATIITLFMERWKFRTTASSETAAWRRETMYSVAHRFVDIGFAVSGTSGNARRARVTGAELGDVQEHLDRCHELHGELTSQLTALRLIAPKEVVLAAEAMHDSHHRLINSAMGQDAPNTTPATSGESWMQLKTTAANDRLRLLTAIRAVFGIESDVVPFAAGVESSWTVPADEHPPAV